MHDQSTASMKSSLQRTLRTLAEEIGGRHLGSDGERRAQDYIEKEFQQAGYEVVREEFETPGWRCGASALLLEDGSELEAAPCFFSPGGEVQAELTPFYPQYHSKKSLDSFADKVVFAGNYDFEKVAGTNALAEELDKAGAAALIINSPYNDTWSTKIVRSPHLRRMLVFTVSQRTALRLAREVGKPVTLRLDAEVFAHRSCNLVARHRPAGATRGKLVIGGHYDTAPNIPGAGDNASGIAVLLEAARLLRDEAGEWEIDWVAFGGEEYGGPGYGIGGYEYWQQHQGEPIRAMLCLDDLGTYLTVPEARTGRSPVLRELIRSHAERSGLRVVPFRRGSDQGIFHLHGIPTVWFTDGGPDSGIRHFPLHSPQDNLDLIDFDQLQRVTLDIVDILKALFTKGLEPGEETRVESGDAGDVDAIVRLVREIWTMGAAYAREQAYGGVMGGQPWPDQVEAAVRNYLKQPGVKLFKVEREGRLAGFYTARVLPENGLGEIGYNGVDPEFRGLGLGSLMLQAGLKYLKDQGVRHVEVTTGLNEGHAPARAVYEGAGFKPFIKTIRYNLDLQEVFPGN